MEILLSLNRERGTTLVIVSHDPEVAEQARRIIHIRDGIVEGEEIPQSKPAASQEATI